MEFFSFVRLAELVRHFVGQSRHFREQDPEALFQTLDDAREVLDGLGTDKQESSLGHWRAVVLGDSIPVLQDDHVPPEDVNLVPHE